jgi:hypothetical protein
LDSHVKTLGLLCILVGALGGLAGIIYFGVSAGADAIAAYGPVLSYLVTGWMILLLVLMLPCIALGVGLLKFRPWTRSLGAIIAILELLNFPIGTVFGVYALWVLLSPEADQLFTPRFKL